jgi:hypothetical protein
VVVATTVLTAVAEVLYAGLRLFLLGLCRNRNVNAN